MIQAINVSDIVEANGKTIRQNNLEEQHNLPLGTLVEIDADYLDVHGIRLFVVNHSRDCDGTPLYDLSFNPKAQRDLDSLEIEHGDLIPSEQERWKGLYLHQRARIEGSILRHYGEGSLVVILRDSEIQQRRNKEST